MDKSMDFFADFKRNVELTPADNLDTPREVNADNKDQDFSNIFESFPVQL